jgi:Acetyltransferase (GNAT) domain
MRQPTHADSMQQGSLRLKQISLDEYTRMGEMFGDLAARAADANPHMSPAALTAAATLLGAGNMVILCVTDASRGQALVGVWGFHQARAPWAWGQRVLACPVLPLYDVLSLPVVDACCLGPVLELMLSFLRDSRHLPGLIRCTSLAMDTPTGEALLDCLGRHHAALHVQERWPRAVMAPGESKSDGKAAEAYLQAGMGKSHKRYSGRARALAASGKVGFALHRQEMAVAALPRFLALERGGWKGKAGTALASHPAHARYAATLVSELAKTDSVRIAELARDGQPLAMGLLLEAGGTLTFTKAAYDEAARSFAPGFLMQMEVTRALMSDPSFRLMDSGMDDSGNLSIMVWSERRAMAHGLITFGNGPGAWLARHGLGLRQALRQRLRQLRHRLAGWKVSAQRPSAPEPDAPRG